MTFLPFYGFICDNLEFTSVKSSKIFIAHRILCDKNFIVEKEGLWRQVFRFLQIYVFSRCKKTGLIDFPESS